MPRMQLIFSLTLHYVFLSVLVAGKFVGWVDPDTKEEHKKVANFKSGVEYDLVMSDEFEKEGRLFADGEDPMWCAIEKSDDDQTSQGKKSLQVSCLRFRIFRFVDRIILLRHASDSILFSSLCQTFSSHALFDLSSRTPRIARAKVL